MHTKITIRVITAAAAVTMIHHAASAPFCREIMWMSALIDGRVILKETEEGKTNKCQHP